MKTSSLSSAGVVNSRNPRWWDSAYDSAWDRVKAAFERDWDQTKHDFGGKEPDTNQNVSNTLAQAAGKEPIPPRGAPAPDDTQRAHRFGFGARRHYGREYPIWDERLEARLEEDWRSLDPSHDWGRSRQAVRRGWLYEPKP